jgi:hypothetical protein
MAKRAGVTQKVSFSVNREDLAMLKKRAKRLNGGNVSAVFADLNAEIRRVKLGTGPSRGTGSLSP